MSDRPSILAVILAILLPPIGVYVARGLGPAFWVSLVLTILGYVPGMIFSLVAVCTPTLLPGRRAI